MCLLVEDLEKNYSSQICINKWAFLQSAAGTADPTIVSVSGVGTVQSRA